MNREKKILEKSVEKLQKENSELQKEAGKNSELQVTILWLDEAKKKLW